MTTVANGCQTTWNTNFSPLIAPNIALEQIIVDDLSSSSGASGSFVGNTPGTRSGNELPLSTAGILELAIARRYRGGKPKMFLPVGVEGDMSSANAWSSTFITSVHTAWAAVTTAINAISGASITLTGQYNVSYYHGSQANPNPSKWAKKNVPALRATPVTDAVQSYALRTVPGVQRRRRGTS